MAKQQDSDGCDIDEEYTNTTKDQIMFEYKYKNFRNMVVFEYIHM
jgi:hypothetical protein